MKIAKISPRVRMRVYAPSLREKCITTYFFFLFPFILSFAYTLGAKNA